VFPDDLILAAMTRFVFCAGFYSKVIDAKWDSFESAFQKFNPSRCAEMTEERFDKLLKCKDIVRNGPKILSVHKNGQFVMELAEKHGSAAQFFAKWPDADYVGLLDFLKKKANRLGSVLAADDRCAARPHTGADDATLRSSGDRPPPQSGRGHQ